MLGLGYDNLVRVLTQTDPLGKVTSFVYDSRSRLTQRTDPDPDGAGSLTSPVTQWAYNSASELTSTTDPLGRVTSFVYDNLGRRIQVTLPDPDGTGSLAAPVTSMTFDAVNNVLTQASDQTLGRCWRVAAPRPERFGRRDGVVAEVSSVATSFDPPVVGDAEFAVVILNAMKQTAPKTTTPITLQT